MPTIAKIYDDIVRNPLQAIVEEVRLQGLIKLIPERYSSRRMFTSPDLETAEEGEMQRKLDNWRKTHQYPYPTEVYIQDIWMPRKLVTEDKKEPIIFRAYTPIRFLLPTASKETYGELKERIERDTRRVVNATKEDTGGNPNAFYIGNLNHNWIIPESIKECLPITGDSFLNDPARKILVPRIVFDFCLFDIEDKD